MINESDLHAIVKRVVGQHLPDPAPSRGARPVAPQPAAPQASAPAPDTEHPIGAQGSRRVAIGADHGGFPLKESLKVHLEAQGYDVVDCGTHSRDAVDYPDFARAVAELVSRGRVWRGIMVDGAGIGSCMVANKLPGVRASMCYDHATANNAREHNDANVLTLGAGLIGEALAVQITDVWLSTPFAGGRHARRVDKIAALDA